MAKNGWSREAATEEEHAVFALAVAKNSDKMASASIRSKQKGRKCDNQMKEMRPITTMGHNNETTRCNAMLRTVMEPNGEIQHDVM